MLKCILVDDEKKSQNVLFTLLTELETESGIKVTGIASSVAEAIPLIQTEKPDIVFLDIQLHNETAFDLLEKLPKITFQIIFVTAFDKYAIKAIKFAALDYLLKPINKAELAESIQKATIRITQEGNSKHLKVLLENRQGPHVKKIALPTINGFLFIDINEITRCEADSYCTCLYLNDKSKIVVSKHLKEIEELLEGKNFIRAHQSHLVNSEYIKQYIKGEGGELIMVDGFSVPVSRRNRDAVLRQLSII